MLVDIFYWIGAYVLCGIMTTFAFVTLAVPCFQAGRNEVMSLIVTTIAGPVFTFKILSLLQ
jgi:hypothetical protein